MSYSSAMTTTSLRITPPEATSSQRSWKERSVAAYRQRRASEDGLLRATLVAQVHHLTGRVIGAREVMVDLDEQLAWVFVDGVQFRLRRQHLVVVRPCVGCGSDQFESPPLASLADLGYALTAWQPRHHSCQPEDLENWLEND
jgi:hypothetical protein